MDLQPTNLQPTEGPTALEFVIKSPVSPIAPTTRPPALRDEPLIIIKPNQPASPDLADIWAHRELLYFLVWRDLKVRYKQTALGLGWVLLQPLFITLVFTIVLGKLVRVPSDNIPYPLFAYAGIMLWTFFSGAVSITGNCLVGNANLITKIYFPRLIIPLAAIIARLVDLIVVFVILFGLMAYYGVDFNWQMLWLPFFVLLTSLLALGFGMWTSAVNVKYRDVGFALPVLIQLWMFASPVVYGANLVPERWRLAYSLNPMVGIIGGFRASLFGTAFEWRAVFISICITVFLVAYGTYVFQKQERTFADLL